MHALAHSVLTGIVIVSALGALLLCLAAIRAGLLSSRETIPQRRLGRLIAGAVCFAIPGCLIVVVQSVQARSSPSSSAEPPAALATMEDLEQVAAKADALDVAHDSTVGEMASMDTRLRSVESSFAQLSREQDRTAARISELERALKASAAREAARPAPPPAPAVRPKRTTERTEPPPPARVAAPEAAQPTHAPSFAVASAPVPPPAQTPSPVPSVVDTPRTDPPAARPAEDVATPRVQEVPAVALRETPREPTKQSPMERFTQSAERNLTQFANDVARAFRKAGSTVREALDREPHPLARRSSACAIMNAHP